MRFYFRALQTALFTCLLIAHSAFAYAADEIVYGDHRFPSKEQVETDIRNALQGKSEPEIEGAISGRLGFLYRYAVYEVDYPTSQRLHAAYDLGKFRRKWGPQRDNCSIFTSCDYEKFHKKEMEYNFSDERKLEAIRIYFPQDLEFYTKKLDGPAFSDDILGNSLPLIYIGSWIWMILFFIIGFKLKGAEMRRTNEYGTITYQSTGEYAGQTAVKLIFKILAVFTFIPAAFVAVFGTIWLFMS